MDTLTPNSIFPSTVYNINKKEFLKIALKITDEFLKEAPLDNQDSSVVQTYMMYHPDLVDLQIFIAQSSWSILDNQGFDLNNKEALVTDCWGQKFLRGGSHVEHVHAYGSQVSAFYFLEVPEGSSMLALYDPRHTKRQINLIEKDKTKITEASEGILFKVNEGDIYFANAWLPHGFTAHNSDKPFKFIHFNVTVQNLPVQQVAEVI